MNAPREEAEAHAKVSVKENRVYIGNLTYATTYRDLWDFMQEGGFYPWLDMGFRWPERVAMREWQSDWIMLEWTRLVYKNVAILHSVDGPPKRGIRVLERIQVIDGFLFGGSLQLERSHSPRFSRRQQDNPKDAGEWRKFA